MKGYIYKITNKINNKVYIGQTIQSIKDRFYRHCQKRCLSKQEANMAIKRAIFKYGKKNFSLELLETCDREQLDEREIYYIKLYNSYEDGYNCTTGGQNGSYRPYKIARAEDPDVIRLYNEGFSLREIAREYNVDHATIKTLLLRNNIQLRTTRNYKFTSETRQAILDDIAKGISRKEIYNKYKVSHSYVSQLFNNQRRI